MTDVMILALCLGLTYISLKTSFYILKVLAGISWFGMGAWVIAHPIGDNASSPVQTIIMLVCFFVGISMFFLPFWTTKISNGREVGSGWKLPFMPSDEDEEAERQRSYMPSRQERNAAYSQRVRGALHGRRTNRRY